MKVEKPGIVSWSLRLSGRWWACVSWKNSTNYGPVEEIGLAEA